MASNAISKQVITSSSGTVYSLYAKDACEALQLGAQESFAKISISLLHTGEDWAIRWTLNPVPLLFQLLRRKNEKTRKSKTWSYKGYSGIQPATGYQQYYSDMALVTLST